MLRAYRMTADQSCILALPVLVAKPRWCQPSMPQLNGQTALCAQGQRHAPINSILGNNFFYCSRDLYECDVVVILNMLQFLEDFKKSILPGLRRYIIL